MGSAGKDTVTIMTISETNAPDAGDDWEPPSSAATGDRPSAALAESLVERARAEGVELVGQGGLLGDLTKRVLEAGLEAEMDEHLGYPKHDPAGRDGGNSRNGTRTKTVITEVGPVVINVPRDREGTFDPKLVRKRQTPPGRCRPDGHLPYGEGVDHRRGCRT
jgi:putative transposase